MSLITINGEPFYCSHAGRPDAPAVILSNSLGTASAMWKRQVEAFGQDFHVITYDTRGHGRSISNPGPYTIDRLGSDVLGLMDALELDRASFCGISMGGMIGQWLGVHASDRIDRLVLCNTAARIGTPEGWQDRAAQVREQGMGPIADGAASRWFTSDYMKQNDPLVQELLNGLRDTNAEGYAACCDALAQANFHTQLADIHVPTLIIGGEHDPVTTTQDAAVLGQGIPGAVVRNLNASHLSNVEASQAFNAAVLEFLKH